MSNISFSDSFVLTIDGKAVVSSETRPVINPATEEVFANVPLATKQHLDDAVQAASRAFPSWAATPVEKRQELLVKLGDRLSEHASEFAEILVKDVGKPRDQANREVAGSVAWLKSSTTKGLPDETIVDTPDRKVVTRYVPLGVSIENLLDALVKCAAITPWNFPLNLVMWKVVPALVTGNCLVVKPTPFAPLAALKFGELAQEILPPGVLSFLSGNDELGPWMSEHPGIAKVSLTGSVDAGKAVMKSVSSTLKRITLELGGNDAAIILDDVDPKAIAPKLFWGSFGNSGQICIAMKRIYVHEKIYDAVRDALVEFGKTIKVGDPSDASTLVGPVQNANQYEKVKSFFDDCHKNGYKFALGGDTTKTRAGYFLPPSIVDNPPESSRIVQEEPFGPIVPLIKWSEDADVISRANDTDFGLAASVWSNDLDRAQAIAAQIQAGTVWINEHQAVHWDQPFGGFKHSGIGVEHSKHGLYTWVNIQSLTLNKASQSRL